MGKKVLYRETSPVAQQVENLPAMQEMQVQSLGREDPLEEEMATHSDILTWRIPWTEASVQEIWNHKQRSCCSVVSPYL